MNVSIRLLRAFIAVSTEGHVGRAAARLYISQPGLSQDIRRLERHVGTQLFVRTPHGVRLTPAGDVLRADVEGALALFDRGIERARSTARAERARLVVAFSPSVGHQLLPYLLPLLERRLPEVLVDEREVDTGEVAPGVRSGRFDLGLAHCAPQDDELAARALFDEPMCVVLAADHALARSGEPVRLASLAGLSLLLWPREVAPEYYDRILQICDAANLAPEVIPGPRRAIIRSYVLSEGHTFCLLPASTSQLTVPGVAFLPVADAHVSVPLVLIRRRTEDRPEVLAVESAVCEEVRAFAAAAEVG